MEGWKSEKLGNICTIKKGIQFNTTELESTGEFPCINGGILPSGYSSRWNTQANTITISEGGNSCGFVNFITTKFWSGGHCYTLNDLSKAIDNSFLFYAMKGRENLIMDLRVGSGLPNIQQKAIREVIFNYPINLDEQRRIVKVLSKIDKTIAQTEVLIEKQNRIKIGLMQDLLTKGIDGEGNIRNEATHEFKESSLGIIPKDWMVIQLDELLLQKQYGVSIPLIELGDIPVLRMNNLKDSELFLDDLKYATTHISQDLILNDGDVLFNRTNSFEHVGRTGIFRAQMTPYSFASYLIRLVPNGSIKSEYLNLILNYERTQSRIKAIATSAVHQANVNPTNLGKLKFAFPDIEEQKKIIDRLNGCKKLLDNENRHLLKLQSLKTGLMQDLLSGKVRVNDLLKENAVASA